MIVGHHGYPVHALIEAVERTLLLIGPLIGPPDDDGGPRVVGDYFFVVQQTVPGCLMKEVQVAMTLPDGTGYVR